MGLMLQNPASVPCLLGVHEGVVVDNEASSSLMKSKSGRVGVWRGVAAADDESQLEPSEENDELIEEQVEKEAVAECVFDVYGIFWSANIFNKDSIGHEEKRGAG
jgi:hypothetical protein